jgi:hypothetical protein
MSLNVIQNDTHHILYQKTRVLYQIPIHTTNAVYYGVLPIHAPNTPFPVTTHHIRICDTDISQLFCEDINQSVSPKYHLPLYNLSKSAPLTDIQYVQAVCYQEMFYWDILTLEGGTNWLSQNVRMEYHFMLCAIPAGLKSC